MNLIEISASMYVKPVAAMRRVFCYVGFEKKPFAAMQRVFCYVGFEKKISQDNQHLEKQSIHYKTINTSRGKFSPTTTPP
ncbi:hypothetical protein HUZ36_11795 [Pseudoalteromonas sp. McH1-7]|uniref:hypothetical protein n=1 Tax=Pseudoalteromonas sp. McH1-7 TaxID=2745574 RepID=UPI001591C897|nr:hypothetical protein [Pseudoalteromonas sp. McH1-7]NUZ11460.1 hypothetical protein [Pseudoalteromonas sp. McH1-7]